MLDVIHLLVIFQMPTILCLLIPAFFHEMKNNWLPCSSSVPWQRWELWRSVLRLTIYPHLPLILHFSLPPHCDRSCFWHYCNIQGLSTVPQSFLSYICFLCWSYLLDIWVFWGLLSESSFSLFWCFVFLLFLRFISCLHLYSSPSFPHPYIKLDVEDPLF